MTVSANMVLSQLATVTVQTAVEGEVRAVTVDGVPYAHTVGAGETVGDVAVALALLVGARATTPVGAVFQVSPESPGFPLTVVGSTGVLAVVAEVGVSAELRAVARIQTDALDALLRLWLSAATEAADLYIGVDYASLAAIPVGVRLGVYQFVRVMKEGHDQVEGTTSARNQDRSESYADAAVLDRARRAGEALWYGFRADPMTARAPR